MVKLVEGLGASDSRTFWKIALSTLADSRKQWAEYEVYVEDSFRHGFKPHYCRHGRNLWTDYDIACGICEEVGYYSFNYQHEADAALGYAHHLMNETVKRRKLLVPLLIEYPTDPAPVTTELWEWAGALIQKWSN